jgi:hypothetical protein
MRIELFAIIFSVLVGANVNAQCINIGGNFVSVDGLKRLSIQQSGCDSIQIKAEAVDSTKGTGDKFTVEEAWAYTLSLNATILLDGSLTVISDEQRPMGEFKELVRGSIKSDSIVLDSILWMSPEPNKYPSLGEKIFKFDSANLEETLLGNGPTGQPETLKRTYVRLVNAH